MGEIGGLLTAAILLGGIGLALLRVAADAAELPHPDRKAELLLLPVNVAIALFLHFFYDAGLPLVVRTLLTVSILWPCTYADIKARIIPNRVLAVGAAIGLLVLVCEVLTDLAQTRYWLLNALGGGGSLLAAALLCRLVSPKGIGMGDVKLLALVGFSMGITRVWNVLFCSFILLFFFCVFLLLTRRAKRTDSVPFAPFLLLGTLAAVFITGI